MDDERQRGCRSLFRQIKIEPLSFVTVRNIGEIAFHPNSLGRDGRLRHRLDRIGEGESGEKRGEKKGKRFHGEFGG
jgi:hypothetical protein